MPVEGGFWGQFDESVGARRAAVDQACAELAGVLDRHLEHVRGGASRTKEARGRLASSEADLLRQAAAIRSRFRRSLVEQLPAACGADRPTVEELGDHVPLEVLRIPRLRDAVSVPRSAVAASLAALVCGALPAIVAGSWNPQVALWLALPCAALGAGVAVWVTCAPLSAKARRWMFGGAVAAGAGIALLYAFGGFGALFASLRGPGGRKRSLIAAGALALLLTLRLWGRRLSVDASDVDTARTSILADFRKDLLGDLHVLSLLATEASRRPADEDAAVPPESWRALQAEIAQAGRHPERQLDGDFLARCAELLGVPLGSRPRVERFVWTGSAEDKGRYVPRGLVAPGQRVRVTRAPVEERSEDDGELRVVTRGEVIPDES